MIIQKLLVNAMNIFKTKTSGAKNTNKIRFISLSLFSLILLQLSFSPALPYILKMNETKSNIILDLHTTSINNYHMREVFSNTNVFNDSNVDFTIKYDVSKIGSESIISLTIGTNNWRDVVNGIAALNIKISYDSNVFKYIDTIPKPESLIDPINDTFESTDFNKNVLAILYMDKNFTTPITTEGDILVSRFTISPNANPGEYKFLLYGDNVVVDGQLPSFNSIPVTYPKELTYNIPLIYTLGDIDNDGLVQISDIYMGTAILMGRIETPTQQNNKSFDVTQDANLTLSDLLIIKQYIIGKRPSLIVNR